MSGYEILMTALFAILLIFVFGIIRGLNRRKRLWFVGGGKSAVSRLGEMKLLLLRELRDLEDGFASAKIDQDNYDERKTALIREIALTEQDLDRAQSERDRLRERFTLPLWFALLVSGIGLSTPLLAQSEIEVRQEFRGDVDFGKVEVHIQDTLNPYRDFSQVTVVAALLGESELPFNELTQSNWSSIFRRIADIDAPNDAEKVMNITKSKPRGYAWISNTSGKFTVQGLATQQRIAFAALHQGLWWPMANELYLPESGELRFATINIADISTDLTPLVIDNYEMQIWPDADLKSGLLWHQVIVEETITIRNPTNLAIAAPNNEDGEAWLRFHIPPPPGFDASELLNLMSTSWSYFVGTPDFASEADQRDSLLSDVAPYMPWTKGLDWGKPKAHAQSVEHVYDKPGAKYSGSITHPLNLEGKWMAFGAGDIATMLKEDSLQLNISKPVPPQGSLVIRLRYKPGMKFDDPEPFTIDRSYLPAGIRELRARVATTYGIRASGAALELTSSPTVEATGYQLYVAPKLATGFVSEPNQALTFTVAATNAWAAELKSIKEAADNEDAAIGMNSPHPPGGPKANADAPAKEGGLVFASVMSLLAVLFGLGTIISVVWMMRADRSTQLKRIEADAVSEDEGLEELTAMRAEAESGALPPRVYLDERDRIIEGMISAKLREAEEASENKAGKKDKASKPKKK